MYKKNVPFRWYVVEDHGTWAIKYRAYDSDKGKKKLFSKSLGMKTSEYSIENAELLADCLITVISERHKELESARVLPDWQRIFAGESIASDESINKAIGYMNHKRDFKVGNEELAVAIARFFELKKALT